MDDRSAPTRALGVLAWANVGAHGAGLGLAFFAMRPGSPLSPLGERMAYLAGRPPGWSWGWGMWAVCALLLVALLAMLREWVPGRSRRSAAASLALVFPAAGMAVDLLCDAVQIQVLPLAALSRDTGLFLTWERLAFTGGATVANGLYTTGILLMTLALGARIRAPARWAGIATTVFGYAMAVAGLLPSAELLQATAGPTIGGFCLWAVLLARDLKRPPALWGGTP